MHFFPRHIIMLNHQPMCGLTISFNSNMINKISDHKFEKNNSLLKYEIRLVVGIFGFVKSGLFNSILLFNDSFL